MTSTATDRLVLLPAVDVADGQAVRLVQGAAGTETSYGEPLAAALAWQEAGAEWVHLVDLDAAFGRGREPRAARRGRRPARRRRSSCPAASATTSRWRRRWPPAAPGSTSAPPRSRTRQWCASAIARHGERVAVGLDVRGTTLAARGLDAGGRRAVRGAGPAGPRRLRALRRHRRRPGRHHDRPEPRPAARVCAATDRPVVASGGVSSLDDLRAIATLVPLGVEGAIVGKALYAGAFTPGGGAGGGVDMTAAGRSPAVRRGSRWSATRARSPPGDHIWVTGCTSIVDGEVVHEGDPYAQTAQAIRNVAWALEQLDASLDDVVRTRIFVTDISRWEEYGRAHGEAFGEVMPATSMVQVSALIDPRMLVEVEAVAYKPGSGAGERLAVRVIPCLDVDAGRVVKGVNFTDLRDAGDPVEMAQVYDAEGADELTFLDITASSGARETTYDVVRRTAEQVFIPLTVGGGVRTVEDVDRLLRAGADKVGVNTAAIERPDADRGDLAAVRLAGAGAVGRRAAQRRTSRAASR